MPSPAAADVITVAVLTYRRPAQLALLLPLLVTQCAALVPAAARVLVIDNDPDAGAAAAAAELPGIDYAHEPRRGIAAARNRALDEAGPGAALVFIDDDEVPLPGWLAELVSSWRRWQCAAVSGPVLAQFDGPVDSWVTASEAFLPRRAATGDVLPGAATNNLLIDLAAVRAHGLRFDERLGLIGGEDTLFTHQLVARGGVIRWCAEAAVGEPVAPQRATRRWVLRRAYRAGTSWSLMELDLAGASALPKRAELLARAAVRIAQHTARLLLGIAGRDLGARARATCGIASYAGLAMGALGRSYGEYRR